MLDKLTTEELRKELARRVTSETSATAMVAAQKRADAYKEIAEQLAVADAALLKAQGIADEGKVSFIWAGPTYGLGGSYNETDGWTSSSDNC